MCTNSDIFFNLMETIHAIDDLSPEKITRVLNAEIYEVAEPNDDHPRKIYIGTPKNQQDDIAWIKNFKLSVPRKSDSVAIRFLIFELAHIETMESESIEKRFGQPTEMEIAEPPCPFIYWTYVNGPNTLCFEIEKGKLQSVIITKTKYSRLKRTSQCAVSRE